MQLAACDAPISMADSLSSSMEHSAREGPVSPTALSGVNTPPRPKQHSPTAVAAARSPGSSPTRASQRAAMPVGISPRAHAGPPQLARSGEWPSFGSFNTSSHFPQQHAQDPSAQQQSSLPFGDSLTSLPNPALPMCPAALNSTQVKAPTPVSYQFASDHTARELVGVISDAFVTLRVAAGRAEGESDHVMVGGVPVPHGTAAAKHQPPSPEPDLAFAPLFNATNAQLDRVLALSGSEISHDVAVALLKRIVQVTRTSVAPVAANSPGHRGHIHTHHTSGGTSGGLHRGGYDSFRSMGQSPMPRHIAASPFLGAQASSFRRVQFASHDEMPASGAASPAFSGAYETPANRDLPVVEEHQQLIRHTSENPYHDEDDDVIGTSINGYVLVGDLGRGSFGRVMLGCHSETDDIVAIKIVHKSLINRERRGAVLPVGSTAGSFMAAKRAKAGEAAPAAAANNDPQAALRREIAVMKRLKHRHLVALKAVIDDPAADRLYLVMQYVPHGPFLQRLPHFSSHRSEPLTETVARRYTRQLISALRYLHKHNIVHRDVKPENILKGDKERVYLADFGVSEIVDDLEISRRVVGTRGTPAFWAPEMFDDQADAIDGIRQDEWALAVTVYLMLVGRLPFDGMNFHELSEAVQKDVLIVPDTLTHAARDFLKRALDRDAASRLSLADMRTHPFVLGPKPSRIRNRLQDRISVAANLSQEEVKRARTGSSAESSPTRFTQTVKQSPRLPASSKQSPTRKPLDADNLDAKDVDDAVERAHIVRNNSIRQVGSLRNILHHLTPSTQQTVSLQPSGPASTTMRGPPQAFPGIEGVDSRSQSPSTTFAHMASTVGPGNSVQPANLVITTYSPPTPALLPDSEEYSDNHRHGPAFTHLTALAVEQGYFTPNRARAAARAALSSKGVPSFEESVRRSSAFTNDTSLDDGDQEDDSESDDGEGTHIASTSGVMHSSGSTRLPSSSHHGTPGRLGPPSPLVRVNPAAATYSASGLASLRRASRETDSGAFSSPLAMTTAMRHGSSSGDSSTVGFARTGSYSVSRGIEQARRCARQSTSTMSTVDHTSPHTQPLQPGRPNRPNSDSV
jgi:serine/threonine protein kinase